MTSEVQTTKGFLTDTSLCIGCKACEVACKQWNQLPMDELLWEGTSYDNTRSLGATTWRHVTFAELPGSGGSGGQVNWMMMSDVCKHCAHAGCLEACPTGAIVRSEFGTVVVQQDVCNGCGYCVPCCPYGVIELSTTAPQGIPDSLGVQAGDYKAHKCTLCYDRLVDGLEPACAKACPTDSIQFGDVSELKERAGKRVEELRGKGLQAYHYGTEEIGAGNGIGDLGASFILLDEPRRYNLPASPTLPQTRTFRGIVSMSITALLLSAATAWSLGKSDD